MSTLDWILFVLVLIGTLLYYILKAVGEGVDAIKAMHMDVRKLTHRKMPDEWSPDWDDDKPSLIEIVEQVQWQIGRLTDAVEKDKER